MIDIETDKIIKGVNMLNTLGFIITLLGTVVGCIALKMTFDINNKTKEIQAELKSVEIKTIFRFKKEKIQTDLTLIYGRLQNGDLDLKLLKETLVEIKQFENAFSKTLNQKITNIDGIFNSLALKKTQTKILELGSSVHEIKVILDNNIEVFK